MLGWRNLFWDWQAAMPAAWLAFSNSFSFSLPQPALLGLLDGFRLSQEHWNAKVRAREWVVHEMPPEMSGTCPGRAEKGSDVSTSVFWGRMGAVLVRQ